MELSPDQTSAKLSIAGAFTAGQIDTLISDLAQLRANMTPSVPLETPKRSDPTAEQLHVSSQDDPYLSLRLLRDGRIRIWLRNQGLGWMIFNIPVAKACTMRDYLIANTPKINPGPDLFSNEIGGGDKAH